MLTFPELGKKVDFVNTRALSIEHFSLFYEIQKDKIIIIGFWDTRRDSKKLKEFLNSK